MLAKIAVAWTRAWGFGETDAFEAIASENYVRHSKTGDEGLESVLAQIRESHEAFSDFDVEIINAVDDGQLIAIHWRSKGRHTGTFMEVPPTYREVSVDGAAFLSYSEGKITDETSIWDPRELLSSMRIWHLGKRRPSPADEKGVRSAS